MKRKLRPIIVSLAIPLAVGGLAAGLTGRGFKEYASMPKPPLAPPPLMFPIAWSALYVLMGIGSYLVYASGDERREGALTVYGVQLLLNFLWPLLFFGAELYGFAFGELVLLFIFAAVMTVLFYRIKKPAAMLQLPYLAWLMFAGYLNLWTALY